MGKDTGWKEFLSDDERYADVINGIGCKGKQEGKTLGKNEKLREQVEKKVKKGLSIPEIADMLEESEETIEAIVKRFHS